MNTLQPYSIAGSDVGLQINKKAFLLPDKGFPVLENAYVYRDRVVKRYGLKGLGRLQRNFTNVAAGNFNAAPQPVFSVNLFALSSITEPDATIVPGSVSFSATNSFAATYTWTDENQDGRLVVSDTSPAGYNEVINNIILGVLTTVFITGSLAYVIGDVVYISGIADGSTTELNGNYYTVFNVGANFIILSVDSSTFSPYVPASGGRVRQASAIFDYLTSNAVIIANSTFSGVAVTVSFSYYPNLPVMGIWQREIPSLNDEETVFFDTTYAYKFVGNAFQEFAPGTTWAGTDADFFWATNWRGSTPESRLFFVTNFVNDAADAIRYTSGGAWTDFAPLLSDTPNPKTYLTQARIFIPYYGRLIALNVWESPDNGVGAPNYGAGVNIQNRARYSQIGDPTAVDAWRSDLFGKGGFIDAPTSEQIISAVFFKNTLIVFFERTTWQLRYVGEYGIPFIWERISSDFGSESTFSTVLFDQGVAAVGDRAIISSNAVTVDRIDLQIPDFVFEFRNALNGPERVVGIRDFQKELVYWTYNDFNSDSEAEKFPNHVLIYNYRNNTYAIFRDNVTFFGTFQPSTSITWDSEDIFWDDEGVTWDTPPNQSLFPYIVSGNQQGFIHYYNDTTSSQDEASLSISEVDLTTTPIRLTIVNHNLDDGDTIYLTNLHFVDGFLLPIPTDLNNKIYRVQYIDDNTIGLLKWDFSLQQYVNNFSFTPPSTSAYVGGGLAALFPKLDVQTKDFNPYLMKGGQAKLAYIDFLMDATPSAVMTVNLYANTQTGDPSLRANITVGNRQSETYLTPPYYSTPVSDIAWHRFYATLAAQFIRIQMTYDDNLMNTLTTHQQTWILNALTLWVRPGGKMIF